MKKVQKSQKSVIKTWWVVGGLVVIAVLYGIWQKKDAFDVRQEGPSSSQSQFVTYTGNGYEIKHPQNWTVDESEQEAPAVIIVSPDKQAKVYIQPQYDPRLTTSSEQDLTIQAIKESFTQNPDYQVVSYKKTMVNGNPALLVTGAFKDQAQKLDFREYTIFGKSGDFYTLRINNKPGDWQKIIDGMAASFKITGPNADEVKARNLVEKVAEVVAFQKQVAAGGRSTFAVRVDRSPTVDEPYYVVQVYEIFPDHQTTFNWYRVSPKTWIVERQGLATDKWIKVK